MFHSIFSENVANAIGWTVVHSLWQATLIAILMMALMAISKRKTAIFRYYAALSSLFLVFIAAFITFYCEYTDINNNPIVLLQNTQNAPNLLISEAKMLQKESFSLFSFLEGNLNFIVTMWLWGVIFFVFRLLGGFGYIYYLKNYNTYFVDNEIIEQLKKLTTQISIQKNIHIFESSAIRVPMVIGWLKPVILMPIGTINSLSPREVEAILAHELAHIARHDYFLNIIQSLIEVLFYYHPAVWWISANIRAERENCCDDIAIRLCGSRMIYAKALVKLQEKATTTPQLALSFTGKKRYHLLDRIHRILNQPQNKSNIMEKLTATGLLFALILLFSFTQKDTLNKKVSSDSVQISTDSIPNKTTFKSTTIRKDDDKEAELKMENGNITMLKVDGKEIPKENYGDYQGLINEMMPPPLPPTPPTPPTPGALPPLPPTPPMPPSADHMMFSSKNKTVRIEKDDHGNQIIRIEGNGEPMEIRVEKDGNDVIVNGKKVKEGEAKIFEGNSDNENLIFNFNDLKDLSSLKDLKFDFKFDKEMQADIEKEVERAMNDAKCAQKDAEKAAKLATKEYHKATKEYHSEDKDNLANHIENELLADDFIEDSTDYTFELNAKKLKINGKTMSDNIFNKYRKIYEEETGTPLKKGNFILNKK